MADETRVFTETTFVRRDEETNQFSIPAAATPKGAADMMIGAAAVQHRQPPELDETSQPLMSPRPFKPGYEPMQNMPIPPGVYKSLCDRGLQPDDMFKPAHIKPSSLSQIPLISAETPWTRLSEFMTTCIEELTEWCGNESVSMLVSKSAMTRQNITQHDALTSFHGSKPTDETRSRTSSKRSRGASSRGSGSGSGKRRRKRREKPFETMYGPLPGTTHQQILPEHVLMLFIEDIGERIFEHGDANGVAPTRHIFSNSIPDFLRSQWQQWSPEAGLARKRMDEVLFTIQQQYNNARLSNMTLAFIHNSMQDGTTGTRIVFEPIDPKTLNGRPFRCPISGSVYFPNQKKTGDAPYRFCVYQNDLCIVNLMVSRSFGVLAREMQHSQHMRARLSNNLLHDYVSQNLDVFCDTPSQTQSHSYRADKKAMTSTDDGGETGDTEDIEEDHGDMNDEGGPSDAEVQQIVDNLSPSQLRDILRDFLTHKNKNTYNLLTSATDGLNEAFSNVLIRCSAITINRGAATMSR